MFKPDDPLAPSAPVFDEPWHAQVLALADTMIRADHFTATQWAEALGAALKQGEADGAPDTSDSYYTAALAALESLTTAHGGLSTQELATRREDWKSAYLSTPHGQPVKL